MFTEVAPKLPSYRTEYLNTILQDSVGFLWGSVKPEVDQYIQLNIVSQGSMGTKIAQQMQLNIVSQYSVGSKIAQYIQFKIVSQDSVGLVGFCWNRSGQIICCTQILFIIIFAYFGQKKKTSRHKYQSLNIIFLLQCKQILMSWNCRRSWDRWMFRFTLNVYSLRDMVSSVVVLVGECIILNILALLIFTMAGQLRIFALKAR